MILKNPITNTIKNSINDCAYTINIAVPFISCFAISILSNENIVSLVDKKIITRFDESYINSFDLPTLEMLINLGFEIRFDNNIHLKLYIIDNDSYVSSSNLTKGGFEDNIELTVKVDEKNNEDCKSFFDVLWNKNVYNNITLDILKANKSKYELLKKRSLYLKEKEKTVSTNQFSIVDLDIENMINIIISENKDYSQLLKLEFEANKLRNATKKNLKEGFDPKIFYVIEGHPSRKHTLFYDFSYGYEYQLAGSGLRESHFQSVFEHPYFEKIINYIFPDMIGMPPWNFHDKNILKEFCKGIFDFDLPSYKEAMPIRLASYFYPDFILPIFKLDHLDRICKAFGFETNSITNGDRLFIYNSFLAEKMSHLPFKNVIKGNIAYQVYFTAELLDRLNKGESYDSILNSYTKVWIKSFIVEGQKIIIKLNEKSG